MAVVQISKIQVRRGRKNSGTSLPQLASGELGWAIDSQELFIGNGSVSEGAPYVGNTKVITEHDNILDLALQYQYKRNDATIQTGLTASNPVQRTVQERLDDTVSIRSFGAVGDGETDDTLAIQRAIDQLYLNDATKGSEVSRIVLNFEAGVYYISEPLRVPPFATLRGAGEDKTVIQQHGLYPAVVTVNELSTPGSYSDISTTEFINQPRNIEVSGMTFENLTLNYPALQLDACRDSTFKDIKFKGVWEISSLIDADGVGIRLAAKSAQVTTTNVLFENCSVTNFAIAVQSKDDTDSNNFETCKFAECGYGFVLGGEYNGADDEIVTTIDGVSAGKLYGPQRYKVVESNFIDIDRVGLEITTGLANVSENNTYIRVGNDSGDSSTAVYPVINFVNASNVSISDYFERSVDLTSRTSMLMNSPYVPEVGGKAKADHKFNKEIIIAGDQVNSPLLRLPASTSASYVVRYFYNSETAGVIRQGTMYLTVDKMNNEIHFTDDCSIIGNDTNQSKLSFSATLEDVDLDTEVETAYIRYTNTMTTDGGYFNYWYETVS